MEIGDVGVIARVGGPTPMTAVLALNESKRNIGNATSESCGG